MTELERQLSALLKEAPGEPPITLDPDELVLDRRPWTRYLAPLLAAAAVLAIGVPAAVVLLDRGASPQQRASTRQTGPVHRPTAHQPTHRTDPQQAAIHIADEIIAAAPAPPGAVPLPRSPLAVLDKPSTVPLAQHVQRTRFWTAPGTVAATIAYLDGHQPKGMWTSGHGSSTVHGIPTTHSVYFQGVGSGARQSAQYTVVAYRSGVAIRADVQVLWSPRRDPADTVPDSVTSVDVLVVRQNPQQHQGAPTVRRVFTGADARGLAEFVNRLPRAIPSQAHSCPAEFAGERWFDRLVFHSAGPTATVVVDMTGCGSITFQIGHRARIALGEAHGGVNAKLMSALGLPPDYG